MIKASAVSFQRSTCQFSSAP